MEELCDPNKVLVQPPLWYLGHTFPGVANPYINVTGAGGERATPLFTDEDLCKRFQSQHPPLAAHYAVNSLGTWAEVLVFLDAAEQKGHTHVVIDQSGRGTSFYAIPELRAEIHKGRGSGPGAS
jgi:hypothetical protein